MDYFIGLDMGTSSVGWAVTDKDYKILRAKGKDLWGVREFEPAKTAADRRTKRIDRRRRKREKARLGMLRLFFDEEIKKTDLSFEIDFAYLEEIVTQRDLSRTALLEKLANFFEINKKSNKVEYEAVKAVCGLKFSLSTLLEREIKDEAGKDISMDFNGEEWKELCDTLDSLQAEYIYALKSFYDTRYLMTIMKGFDYLSQERVQSYEKHKADLKLLKDFIKENASESYDSLFRDMLPGSYSAYVGSSNAGRKMRRNVKENRREDLYQNLKKIISKLPESETGNKILEEIRNETFLPKQLTSANGVIPNQVHLAELNAILRNVEQYHPFLQQKDETGFSVSEKISQLFAFQIPYYVGPLWKTGKNNAWVVRKEESGRVFPWNFEEKIDVKRSSEEFIKRLVKSCTYLEGKKVLPKASLLYERYMALNELNNLKINGEKIPVPLKQELYNHLFAKGKKVKRAHLENYLIANGWISQGEEDLISGIDGDFKNTLSSYGKFRQIFGEKMANPQIQAICEEIIFYGTIYGEDKKFLEEILKEKFPDTLSDEDIKRIKGFRFKDWGSLSEDFLRLEGCSKSDGEILPLIDALWQNNENLMELLSSRYTYAEQLRAMAGNAAKPLKELSPEDLEGFYFSAPVKRMVWQTILVLDEIVGVMGCEPKKLFIEMARGPEETPKGSIPGRANWKRPIMR